MHGISNVPALRLRITLEGIEPPTWRRVIFSKNATLHELHSVIQVLFVWYDYHLYQFEFDGRHYEVPHEDAEGEDSTMAKLSKLITGSGQVFNYVYDFGDGWVHTFALCHRQFLADRPSRENDLHSKNVSAESI